ncbi:hypothetical protein A2797_01265 [candidate division WWE3 bacterium RIFCSPHIGHO2_01_FULL_48_15]|uniref:EamA domain-containing protein n=1 Tax=candidate division WWE3 bacterium RIFCSPHIGHO2_01_FULL_48_15 TaxID=1802619 RepID=A0A1F4VG76_UNCKA|nr:MAG: hypothetical protein A2797_01265 [candidate division WWE3 bacterium RIFCSPHIGHO2_01_FULL_48_15]
MPVYLLAAVASYFLLALAGLVDKILLKTTIVSPRAYAFFVGILGILALVFIPFGVSWPLQPRFLVAALASGVTSVYALWSFYSALKDFDPSRAITTVGALIPVFTLIFSIVLFAETHVPVHFLAIFLLVLGGVLISIRENVLGSYSFELFRHAVLAASLFAFSLALLRFVFINETFINGLFWSRIGTVLGAVSILVVPENFRRIWWAAKKAPPIAPIPFLLNQGLGGTGALLQTFAISLGSATLVSALQGIQYAFIFVLLFFLAPYFPALGERFDPRENLAKAVAIVAISTGLYILALG